MASWVPQEQGLQELIGYLQQTTQGSSEAQNQVRESLDRFNAVVDYNNYLCYILVTPLPNLEPTHRAVAGYLLVKHFRTRARTIDPEVYEYLKANLWQSLSDENLEIRRSGANCVNRLIQAVGPENWPESLLRLVELMNSTDINVQEAAFLTTNQLCEDITAGLDTLVIQGERPLDYLIPQLINGIQSSNQKIRISALSSLIPFIMRLSDSNTAESSALGQRMNEFIPALFKIANDPSLQVRKKVCQTIVQALANRPEVLLPHLNDLVDYMLMCTKDDDQDLAMEACEFWLTFAESHELEDALRTVLPKVAPVLLDCTVYGEFELATLGADEDEDDAERPDRDQDIKPRFHSGKSHRQEREESEQQNNNNNSNDSNGNKEKSGGDILDNAQKAGLSSTDDGGLGEDEENDDDDDDDDFDDDDDNTDWSLRKCAAAALDVMAVNYGDALLQLLLPHLKDKLWSEDWLQRESGILALGAIAEGCYSGLEEHLPVLFPFLLQTLDHPKPLVRSITCWTLGRYSVWCAGKKANEEVRKQYFLPLIEGLLKKVLDNNKRVQEAGCSAFAALEEDAGELLIPYLGPILKNLVYAFNKYQKRNLLILYDAIGTLADSVGDALNREDYLNILMPPITQRWDQLADDDQSLVPLMECLSSIICAAAHALSQFLGPIFERCVRIVHSSLFEYEKFKADPVNVEQPDPLFLICALDLMSAVTTSTGEAATSLYINSNPPAVPLLQYSIDHSDGPARQSALALLGDVAINCFPVIEPVINMIMPIVIKHMEVSPKVECIGACNNAIWSSGEISLQYKERMEPFVDDLMSRLVPILLSPTSQRSLIENSAVTIGRLGYVCPAKVAPHLETFGGSWCHALADIRDNPEKDSAFRGICLVIQANPAGISRHLPLFLNAVAWWRKPSPELFEMFRNIFAGFRSMGEEQWTNVLNMLPEKTKSQLTRYMV